VAYVREDAMTLRIDRRTFLRGSGAALGGVLATAATGGPLVLTARRTRAQTARGSLAFEPVFVQAGRGPHLSDLVYATDANEDAYPTDAANRDGRIVLSDLGGQARFALNVRWNVEGFGYLFLSADNAGELYDLPARGQSRTLNLNVELARTRVSRNAQRLRRLSADGWAPSREVRAYLALSEEYLVDALKGVGDRRRGELAQQSLRHALWAGEGLEVERGVHDIERQPPRREFFLGCDARAYFQMDADVFLERFVELFNFATVNHYLIGTHQDFEPTRGNKRFNLRDALVDDLRREGITVEGRPLVWFHRWVTPDWMRAKTYPQLLAYVEEHVRAVVGHYRDRIAVWEIANEMHDWANELRLTPDQMIEVTTLACEVARDTNPKILRLINNCCVFGEYVHQRKWTELDATHPQRTPHQFMRELLEAGAPVDVTGVQMYFPSRDLVDSIRLIDRFIALGKPVHVTEIGATSGPSGRSVKLDTVPVPTGPYAWHRHWDQELQAEWAERMYTLAYSRPAIEAVSWYDFIDTHAYIRNGGVLESPAGERKPIFDRLKALRERWQAAADTAAVGAR
jgi:endo-1,4-beta-xylanase